MTNVQQRKLTGLAIASLLPLADEYVPPLVVLYTGLLHMIYLYLVWIQDVCLSFLVQSQTTLSSSHIAWE